VDVTTNGRGTLARSDDANASYGICESAPGSLANCTTTADCAELEGCYATTDATGALQNVCVQTLVTGLAGDLCATVACRTPGGCIADWWSLTQYCTEACTTDADCGDTGLVCRVFRDDRLNVRRPLCVRPDDPRAESL
jgi:hypothetical protein